MRVEKADPRVFVEDIEDAIQLGATSILVGGQAPPVEKKKRPN
jgi:hypothetical protein